MPIRMAQYGTKHGHAAGKAQAMQENPDVELVGIYEPDPAARAAAQASGQYGDSRFVSSAEEILEDARIVAVAIEGSNAESLAMAHQAVAAGKHIWYDKPAGDDWLSFVELARQARARSRLIQMGYMFRYHAGFQQIAAWAHSGLLGDVYAVRAHMSTNIPVTSATAPATAREGISAHRGGIFYDLAGHMLDQIVWLLGRPRSVQAYLRNDATPEVPAFADNTLGVLEYERAIAFVDIAAMEARPMARRFEVYGTRGTALMEPFEPRPQVRLCLEEAAAGFDAGLQTIPIDEQPRQRLYARELAAFVATLRGEKHPDRSLDHELLVQETLLRATGGISP